MKKTEIILLMFLFCTLLVRGQSFSGVSGGFITDSKPPEVIVISPNGGGSYFYTDSLYVEWYAYDDTLGEFPITISISTDGGMTYNDVATGLPNTDSAYVIPPQENTDQAIAKVFVQDVFGLTNFDISDSVFSLHGVLIDLEAFLQGPYTVSGMTTLLNSQGFLPLSQPYGIAPWNYNGDETADPIPNSDIVDWVLIEIREAPDASSATEATTLAKRAGFILNSGAITDIDGSSNLQFGIEVNDKLFAVVHHRNHLAIMSADSLSETAGVYSYDFTTSANKVYGGENAHSQLISGSWGLTCGDANTNGQIDNVDKDDIWLPDLNNTGYLPGDFDMNGTVQDIDKEILWESNSGRSRKIND